MATAKTPAKVALKATAQAAADATKPSVKLAAPAAKRAAGKPADFIPDPDEIVRRLVPELKGNEVILVMSNGGFGGIHGKLLDALA